MTTRDEALERESGTERGWIARLLLRSPKDTIAVAAAFVAITAIVGNALLMQAGRHPSPMFGAAVAVPLAMPQPLPRPRPVEMARPTDTRAVGSKTADSNTSEARPVEHTATAPRAVNPPTTSAGILRPPAPVPTVRASDPVGELIVSNRRTAAVQRALTDHGYGQLKPTGTVGSETQIAIQKFERERKLPVTGQVSDRLIREIAAVTGRAID